MPAGKPTTQELYDLLPQAYKENDMETVARIKAALPAAMKEERQASLRAQAASDPWYSQAAAGFSEGVRNIGRHALAMMPGSAGQKGKEYLQEAKDLYEPATDTAAGGRGRFLGEMAVTAPLSAGAGGAVRGVAGLGAKALGRSILPRATALAAQFAEGAVPSYIMADEEDKQNAALTGGGLSIGLPWLLGKAGKAVTGLWRPKVGSAGERLIQEGVDLSAGRANPRGFWNQMEELSQTVPWLGRKVMNQTEDALGQWRRAAVKTAHLPGMGALPEGNIVDQLDFLRKSFRPEYDRALKGIRIAATGGTGPGAKNLLRTFNDLTDLDQIVARGGPKVNDLEAEEVRKYLTRLLRSQGGTDWKALEKGAKVVAGARGAKPVTIPQWEADKLQWIRSEIKDAAAQARTANKTAVARLYGEAADIIDENFKRGLPAGNFQKLSEIDQAYSNFRKVADAAGTAQARVKGAYGDPGGFTPIDLERKSLKGLTNVQKGTGVGNDVTELAEAGYQPFRVREHPTGHKVAMGALLTGAGLVGPAAGGQRDPSAPVLGAVGAWSLPVMAGLAAANPTARKYLTGRYGFQQSLHKLATKHSGDLLVKALRQGAIPAYLAHRTVTNEED